MNALNDPNRSRKIVFGLLVIAVLVDRFLIAGLAPELSGLAAINPMIVILDIPIGLPFASGLIPVFGVFIFCWWIMTLPYDSLRDPYAWMLARKRCWKVSGGVLAIPVCVVTGGLAYEYFQDQLPKPARHAIESVGINMDLYTALPGHERIRLKGSMVMLGRFFIGLYIFNRRTRAAAGIKKRTTVPVGNPNPDIASFPADNPGPALAPDPVGTPGFFHTPEPVRAPGPLPDPASARTPIPLQASLPIFPEDPPLTEIKPKERPGVYVRYPEPRVHPHPVH